GSAPNGFISAVGPRQPRRDRANGLRGQHRRDRKSGRFVIAGLGAGNQPNPAVRTVHVTGILPVPKRGAGAPVTTPSYEGARSGHDRSTSRSVHRPLVALRQPCTSTRTPALRRTGRAGLSVSLRTRAATLELLVACTPTISEPTASTSTTPNRSWRTFACGFQRSTTCTSG